MAVQQVDQKKNALVCIPSYNERQNIEAIVPAVLEQVPFAHVLVIDDNSPDGTGELADALAAKDARVHVLHRPEKEGLGKAYIAGFKWALDRDFWKIVEFDADFSHNPAVLPTLLARLDEADAVVGSRRVAGGGVENWNAMRRLISFGGSFYAKTILGIPVCDLTGGFNGFLRTTLEKLDLDAIHSSGYAFQIEIKYRVYKLGLKIVEIPIIFTERVKGQSKMSQKIFLEALLAVWRLRFKV